MSKETGMMATAPASSVAEEDRLRADLYNFLGLILSAPPDQLLLEQTAGLQGDDGELGQAITTLAKLARMSKPASVESEYNRLFIGLGRGELLRSDMQAQGLRRADTVFEPEDNIASLMEMMGAMIVGRFGAPASLQRQKDFFMKHINPWAGLFFGDLEGAKNSVFYAPVGSIGRAFMEIEAEAFRMSARQA
jgi:TorA maturation chaperone TorD